MSDDEEDAFQADAMDEDDDYDEDQDQMNMGEALEGEDNTFHATPLRPAPPPRRSASAPPNVSAAVERDQLIPFQQPAQDPREMPVSYVVTDTVALYGNVSLWTLMYGQATRGIVAPVLCDAERGTV